MHNIVKWIYIHLTILLFFFYNFLKINPSLQIILTYTKPCPSINKIPITNHLSNQPNSSPLQQTQNASSHHPLFCSHQNPITSCTTNLYNSIQNSSPPITFPSVLLSLLCCSSQPASPNFLPSILLFWSFTYFLFLFL